MRRLVQGALLVSVLLTSVPAFACWRGAHSHVGSGGISINLGGLAFGFSTFARHAPCPTVVLPAPVVVEAPPPVFYRQDPQVVYAPPPVVYSPPPVVYAPPPVVYAPPPVTYSPPPVVVAPPPVQYAPPPVVAAPAPVAPAPSVAPGAFVRADKPAAAASDRPAFLAVKYMPGAAATVTLGESLALGGLGAVHDVGVELRLSRWFALRSDVELRSGVRSWDALGAKVWLSPSGVLRPYASVSVSGTELAAQPGRLHIGVVGAAGLDLMLGRHFFLEAEARYRVAPGDCCREVPQLTGLVGGGIAFF